MSAQFCIYLDDRVRFVSPEQYGMRMLEREISEPAKDNRTERVPFSSITHDFNRLYGTNSYAERTLTYTFDLLTSDRRKAQGIAAKLQNDLHWFGFRELHDSMYPDFHFDVREPDISFSNPDIGVYSFRFQFKAYPAMLSNQTAPVLLIPGNRRYPDINGDGHVTAADAALILTAAEKVAAGQPTEMTAQQQANADADLDGVITENDALLVLEYAAAVTAGEFEDTEESWFAFIRQYFMRKEGVY